MLNEKCVLQQNPLISQFCVTESCIYSVLLLFFFFFKNKIHCGNRFIPQEDNETVTKQFTKNVPCASGFVLKWAKLTYTGTTKSTGVSNTK